MSEVLYIPSIISTGEISIIEAVEDGDVVGYALYNTNLSGMAVLWHIYVDRKKRRQGIGSGLIDEMKTMFSSVLTQVATEEADGLLAKCGFRKDKIGYVWESNPRKVVKDAEDAA